MLKETKREWYCDRIREQFYKSYNGNQASFELPVLRRIDEVIEVLVLDQFYASKLALRRLSFGENASRCFVTKWENRKKSAVRWEFAVFRFAELFALFNFSGYFVTKTVI